MSDVSQVVKYFSTINEGFSTTLGSIINAGDAIVPLTSSAGLTNGTVFVGLIEPGGAKQQVFTGTVDTANNQITSVKWTRGSNTSHAAGVTIVDYVTGTDWNMLTTGILKQHKQDGSHSAVTADSLTVASGLTVNGGAVNLPTASLSRSAIDWSTFNSNIKTASNTTVASPSNGVNNDFGPNGASITFTVSAACAAFVTVNVACTSTTDFEIKPQIFVDGVITAGANYPANIGGSSFGRATQRSYTAGVAIPSGTHTLSAGMFMSSASSAGIAVGAANITAIVLGNVTA